MSLIKRGMINNGNFDTMTKGKRTKVRTATQRDALTVAPKTGMTGLGVKVRLPVKGVCGGVGS